jgi:diguanylate cyclase (GGDEF)-like protein
MLGHIGGDGVLMEIAGRLRAEVRESDTVSRWGGDEFACVIEDVSALEDARQVVEKILLSMSAPVLIHNQWVEVSISLGVSLYPMHARQKEDLLRCADAALYRAKETRNSFQIYDDSMQSPFSKKGRLFEISLKD